MKASGVFALNQNTDNCQQITVLECLRLLRRDAVLIWKWSRLQIPPQGRCPLEPVGWTNSSSFPAEMMVSALYFLQ